MSHLVSPIPESRRSLGHHRWFCNQFPPIPPMFSNASGTWRTLGLSIHWCGCLPTSSSVCLLFSPLSLRLAKRFWLTWWTGDMTIPLQIVSLNDGQEVFVWSNCLLDLGTDFLVGNNGLCMRCVVYCCSTSFPWLVYFFGALLWGSMIHKHTGRWMWQGSALVVSWNWEKYSCHSKLVSTLSMLLKSVLPWRSADYGKLMQLVKQRDDHKSAVWPR